MLGIVGIILGIIGIGLNTTWSGILGLLLTLVANGCLLFAALSTNSSINSRSIGLLVYLVFEALYVIIIFIGAILLFIAWGGGTWSSDQQAVLATAAIIYLIAFGLGAYFMIVVWSYYQELKGGSGPGSHA